MTAAIDPIDDDHLIQRVISASLAAERQPLVKADLPAGPGGYALFLGPGEGPVGICDTLLAPMATGEMPLYAGAAVDLAGRAARYKSPASLAGAQDFPMERVWIAAVPTRTTAGAVCVEAVLIAAFQPPFNQPALSGLGSRVPGRNRIAASRVTAFDALFRRTWAGTASPIRICSARLALAAKAIAADTAGTAWPPLSPVCREETGSRLV